MRDLDTYLAEKMTNADFTATFNEAESENSIAAQIIMLRALRGLTQDTLAALARTQQSSISRLESGDGKPSIAFLERVAEALDADLEIRLVPRRSIN